LAKALAGWLPDVIQNVETWMSENDLSAGSRWANELGRQLEECDFGVLCLTRESLTSPWLLFEAGSLAKHLDAARVVPYRLGLKTTEVEFPLAQFQGVDANRSGTLSLLQSLNSFRDNPMSDDRLERVFSKWWPDLEKRIKRVPQSSAGDASIRGDRDLLEEILDLTRTQHAVSLMQSLSRSPTLGYELIGDFERTIHVVSAEIYWHKEGFSRDQAVELVGVLKTASIPSKLAEHRDPTAPDAVFIGALVGANAARLALSAIPYQISYVFRPDYPEEQGGTGSGLKLGIGYLSTHYSVNRGTNAEPVKVSEDDLKYLTAPRISNVEFQRRLRKVTETD
jgi:hypothetical protein